MWYSLLLILPLCGVRRGRPQPRGHTPQFRGLAVHHLWPGSCSTWGDPTLETLGFSVIVWNLSGFRHGTVN